MQCVILAAGEGLRMRPLTEKVPKPLIQLNGKPTVAYLLDTLPKEVDEIVLVVGYLGQQIVDGFGDSYNGKKISYVWQSGEKGTYSALRQCRQRLKEGFFCVGYADNLFDPGSIRRIVKTRGLAMMAALHDHPERFGVLELNPDETVKELIEKPEHPRSNLVNAGFYCLDQRIFEEHPLPRKGEYYLTDAVERLTHRFPVHVVTSEWWFTVGLPEDIPIAERLLREREKRGR